MFSPERLAEILRTSLPPEGSLRVIWVAVAGPRDEFADRLNSSLESFPGVSLVVRKGFDNANALLNDVTQLLEENRTACEQGLSGDFGVPAGVSLILLARSELNLPQTASPVTLPEWFPLGGGQSMMAVIEDITWTASAPLNAPEARLDELCSSLFELETSLISRLRDVHDSDHGAGNALLELIRREDEKYPTILENAAAFSAEVRNPTSFRPSVKEGRSLISRLWGLTQKSSPDELHRPSKALGRALALPEQPLEGFEESLASVLRRPHGKETEWRVRFGRNLLVTSTTACSLITSAAHADDYPPFPIPLLKSISLDLRTSLRAADFVLRQLS
jgi:hypothetical protein